MRCWTTTPSTSTPAVGSTPSERAAQEPRPRRARAAPACLLRRAAVDPGGRVERGGTCLGGRLVGGCYRARSRDCPAGCPRAASIVCRPVHPDREELFLTDDDCCAPGPARLEADSREAAGRGPLVEILYFDGCPNHEPARALVERLGRELGSEPRIQLVNVPDQ